ncbi:MAG: hypothetical protein P8Y23_13730 [Candidatus Lokiarchaeota archaeon]
MSTNWQNWFEISSPQEFEEECLKNSGLDSVNDFFEKLKTVKTDSKQFSVDLNSFLENYEESDVPIFCHTSGPTNSTLSALKWFFMSKEVVKRNWAPGMQAIFESSGLSKDKSAIIFVPSRIKYDGLQTYNGQDYISLYSSEFSQRVMLSIIKPKSYLLYEYKFAKSLPIIAKMLQLKEVAVISAPALTILNWANKDKLKAGIAASLQKLPEKQDAVLKELIHMIQDKGLEDASNIIYKRLSKKLSHATIIFSISSLSEDNWNLIRNFMKWEKDKEKFTNLYVISEVGPFAASIAKENYEISPNHMLVFPLSFATLKIKSQMYPLSQITNNYGKLFVSRISDKEPLINIDLGDVISVVGNESGLPVIEGKILRSSFKLHYPIKLSDKIRTPFFYNIYAGDYFRLNGLAIKEPRKLLFFLKEKCGYNTDSMLLIAHMGPDSDNRLILPYSSSCMSEEFIKRKITEDNAMQEYHPLFQDNKVKIKLINDQPVNFFATHKNKLEKVRNGDLPKGILKRWPLYVLK